MTSKSKKDKIKQGNLKDFDLLYDVLVNGGTYSNYRLTLLDRSMPQEMPLVITEDDILAAWILGKDEESELYAKGGHIHQDIGSQIKMAKMGVNLYMNGAFDEDKNKGLYSSDSGHNYTAGIPYVQQFDSLGGLGFNVAANANGASNDPYAKFIMGDTSGGFLQLMMSLKSSLREGANYIKSLELNFGVGDNAYLAQQYNQMQPIARSTMDADAVDTWKWIFDPSGIMHSWGLIDYDASEGLDYLNLIAEQVENRNKQNFNTAVTNSNKLNLWNQLSQPYMAACGGKMKNRLASGGYINSHYDYITDPLVKVDAGGTHQENPNEGVLTSIAPDGEPNLVEEGETIINNGQEDAYVFSDRIVADEEILKSHLLPVKFAGKTYADISKELDKIIEEHKNDEISKRTFDEMISRLQQAQEDQKFQEKQEEVEKFLDGLTDEQKEQLEQTMVEEAEAEQQAAEEQAVAEQQAQELAALEQQMQPEQAPEQVAIEQPEEQIVPSRYDQIMSRTLFADAANQGMFGLGGTLQEGGFIDRLKKTMNTSSHPVVVDWNVVANRLNKPYIEFGGGTFGMSGASGEWGDTDYIKNEPIPAVTRSFDEAFAEARRNGLDTFRFNGKLYSTKVDPNYSGPGKKEIELMTPPMNVRKIYDNTGVELQDSTRVEPYFGQPIGWTERETIDDKTKLKYIGSEPDWDNKKSKGGHLHQDYYSDVTSVYNTGVTPQMRIQALNDRQRKMNEAWEQGLPYYENVNNGLLSDFFTGRKLRLIDPDGTETIIDNAWIDDNGQMHGLITGITPTPSGKNGVWSNTGKVRNMWNFQKGLKVVGDARRSINFGNTVRNVKTTAKAGKSTESALKASEQAEKNLNEALKIQQQNAKRGLLWGYNAEAGVGQRGAYPNQVASKPNATDFDYRYGTEGIEEMFGTIDDFKTPSYLSILRAKHPHTWNKAMLLGSGLATALGVGVYGLTTLDNGDIVDGNGIVVGKLLPNGQTIMSDQTNWGDLTLYDDSNAISSELPGYERPLRVSSSNTKGQSNNNNIATNRNNIPQRMFNPGVITLPEATFDGLPVDYGYTNPNGRISTVSQEMADILGSEEKGIPEPTKKEIKEAGWKKSKDGTWYKKESDGTTTDYSTWLRYAPAVGSGIQYLSDLFGVTNRNDFSNADMYQKSINAIPNIGFTPLGNYMTYSPLDETYQQNVARSQYNAARRAIQNNASGNASAALAAMDSLNGNMNNTFGDLALQAREYNDKQREAVEQFNANIARINSMMSLSTQEKNQAIAAEKARLTYNLANMRENIQNMNDAAKSANENAFYSNLGAIGKENFNMLMVRTNPAFYYTIMDDGSIVYKNGFYDLNKGDLDLITADAEKAQKEQLKKNSEDALKKSEESKDKEEPIWFNRYYGRNYLNPYIGNSYLMPLNFNTRIGG